MTFVEKPHEKDDLSSLIPSVGYRIAGEQIFKQLYKLLH